MKTHRNILIISFIIGIVSLPFLFLLDKGKLYEIMLALFTSSIISFLLELPNYFSLKSENDNKLYYSLFGAKVQASFLINSIENIIFNNNSLVDKFYFQNLNNMNINLTAFNSYDEDYYFLKNKNNKVSILKNDLQMAWQNINLTTLKFSIDFSQLRTTKTAYHQIGIIYAIEMINNLNLIIESCKNFIQVTNSIASIIFTKKQLEKWSIDNIVLENNKINSMTNKI